MNISTIQLCAFETIDGLRNAARYDAQRTSHIHGQPVLPVLNEAQHQSRLFDALIGVLGYSVASEISNLEEYADSLITDCLIGKIEVLDGEAA